MKISLFVFLVSMALLTGGCATNKSNQPDWISGYGVKYTKSEYLLGRGLAKSVEDAKKRALADLALLHRGLGKLEHHRFGNVGERFRVTRPGQHGAERRLGLIDPHIVF